MPVYKSSRCALILLPLLTNSWSDRTQYVNGIKSSWVNVTSGVLQEWHHGPLLFILYLNDTEKYFIYSQYCLYTDDLKLYPIIVQWITFALTSTSVFVYFFNKNIINLKINDFCIVNLGKVKDLRIFYFTTFCNITQRILKICNITNCKNLEIKRKYTDIVFISMIFYNLIYSQYF